MELRTTMLWGAISLTVVGCSNEAQNAPVDTQVNTNTTADAGSPLDAQTSGPASTDSGTPSTAQDAARPQTVLDASAPTVTSDAGPVATNDAGALDGGALTSSDAASGEGGAPMSGMSCLKVAGDATYTAPGPYKFKQKNVTIGSKGQYTIVYPDPLDTACPHPFVAWGNGTFITGGSAYAPFQEHAASYGIITIASHSSSVGDGSFHTAAIDYMLAENKKSGGEFFGKVGERAGVSGHSQGGAGADRGATMHKNVKAIANVQGSFGTPPMSDAAFLCLTGTDDIQPTGCPMAVKAAKVPALCASYQGADHVSTTLGGGTGMDQYKRLYSAWFRCFLADDAAACALFKGGAQCPVCKEKNWAEIFANNY